MYIYRLVTFTYFKYQGQNFYIMFLSDNHTPGPLSCFYGNRSTNPNKEKDGIESTEDHDWLDDK